MFFKRRSPGKSCGFTIVELMVASLITAVILTALVMALRVGDVTDDIGSARSDLQGEVSSIMDWITKDIRQAKIQELNANSPTASYIKYNIWEWDNTTFSQIMTDKYVEYEYGNGILTRREIAGGVSTETVFSNITMEPFYTTYTQSQQSFDNATLLSTRRLIVAVKKETVVRGKVLNFTLVEEIRIRNE